MSTECEAVYRCDNRFSALSTRNSAEATGYISHIRPDRLSFLIPTISTLAQLTRNVKTGRGRRRGRAGRGRRGEEQFKPLFQIRASTKRTRSFGASDNHHPNIFFVVKPFHSLLTIGAGLSVRLNQPWIEVGRLGSLAGR